jgi:hypothetical protein
MRVTERAQHAVLNAKREAGRLGHDRVGTEHLLLGLLGDEQCLAVATLGGLGVAPETVRRRVEETIGQAPGEPGIGFGLRPPRPSRWCWPSPDARRWSWTTTASAPRIYSSPWPAKVKAGGR